MKFFKWFAGFFEDQAGSGSSKRIALYIALYFFWMLVKGSLENKTINEEVLFVTGGLILFCVGAITSEFITKVYQDRKNGNGASKEITDKKE